VEIDAAAGQRGRQIRRQKPVQRNQRIVNAGTGPVAADRSCDTTYGFFELSITFLSSERDLAPETTKATRWVALT
jgi:hypothetical protein